MILLSSPLKNDPPETTVSLFLFLEIEIVTAKIVNSKSLKKICRQLLSTMNVLKRDIPIKRLRNGTVVKSETKRLAEFTNCNLSQRLVELTLPFFNDVEEHEFPSNCTKSYLKLGERFSSTVI